jgi:hypothetical protein
LQAILLCFWGTESPRYSIRFTNSRFSWLIHNNKENEALDSLKKLRGNNSQCQIEWNDMRRLKTDQSRDSGNFEWHSYFQSQKDGFDRVITF